MRARKRKHEEHENHERWLVSYADFITLLFAFFTVLYATSQQDTKKEEEFERSIRKHMKTLMAFQGGNGEDPHASGQSVVPPSIELFPPMTAGPREVQDHIKRALQNALTQQEYSEAIEDVRHDTLGVRIQLTASALFPLASAELKESAASALDKIGQILKNSGRRIVVEGHTDDRPIHTDRFPTNWELSASRATKIIRYLISRHEMAADKLTAVAYGDQRPIVPNDSGKNRARNRRIEILVITGDREI